MTTKELTDFKNDVNLFGSIVWVQLSCIRSKKKMIEENWKK